MLGISFCTALIVILSACFYTISRLVCLCFKYNHREEGEPFASSESSHSNLSGLANPAIGRSGVLVKPQTDPSWDDPPPEYSTVVQSQFVNREPIST